MDRIQISCINYIKKTSILQIITRFLHSNAIIGVNSVALPFVENAKLLNELKSSFENGILLIIPLSQANIFSWNQATKAYVNVLQGAKGSTLLQFNSD